LKGLIQIAESIDPMTLVFLIDYFGQSLTDKVWAFVEKIKFVHSVYRLPHFLILLSIVPNCSIIETD
jgi:hypothetical protein